MVTKVTNTIDDVTVSPQCRTSSCRAHPMPSTKGENFSKYCNITKTQGGGVHQPPLLYHGVGMSLLVCPRITKLAF